MAPPLMITNSNNSNSSVWGGLEKIKAIGTRRLACKFQFAFQKNERILGWMKKSTISAKLRTGLEIILTSPRTDLEANLVKFAFSRRGLELILAELLCVGSTAL